MHTDVSASKGAKWHSGKQVVFDHFGELVKPKVADCLQKVNRVMKEVNYVRLWNHGTASFTGLNDF